jgi:hypothetical protein
MKFVAASDLHISDKRPVNRKGDYWKQVLDKVRFILKTTIEHSDLLVVAGDFFDSPQVPYKVTKDIIDIIKKVQKTKSFKILVVAGQHDLRYHLSGLNNTPLGILESSDCVEILQSNKSYVHNGVSFIGSGWGEDPEVKADVIITHRMITKKHPLWPGQKDYSTALSILNKYKWAKCIISGDNHIPHRTKTKSGRLLINCGSMIRKNKDQLDHEPRIYLINANNWKSKTIKIPIYSIEDAFNLVKIEEDDAVSDAKKQAEELISKFIDSLPEENHKPNFNTDLQYVISQTKPRKGVIKIINEIMEKIK